MQRSLSLPAVRHLFSLPHEGIVVVADGGGVPLFPAVSLTFRDTGQGPWITSAVPQALGERVCACAGRSNFPFFE